MDIENSTYVRLERIQNDAFLPELVFIGPYIPDELKYLSQFERSEQLKSSVIGRVFRGRDNIPEDIRDYMKWNEGRIRDWYSHRQLDGYTSDGLVERMVVDGCFVIAVLRLYWELRDSSLDLPDILGMFHVILESSTLQKLKRDFLMLRNQLPFFLLQQLYSLMANNKEQPYPFNERMEEPPPLRCLAIHFFKELAGEDEEDAGVSSLEDDQKADDCLHLLHLFSYACTNKPHRYLHLYNIDLEKKQENVHHYLVRLSRARKLTYNAKELQEAGIKIKPKQQHTKGGGLMAIDTNFKGTTLRIQPFYLDHNVVFMLLNFLASEYCQQPAANPYFTSYIMFLDCLIDSEADVEILHKAGILHHAFGNNKDVADIIYKVTKELNDPDYNHFQKEMTELNSYCKAYYGSKWRPWWHNLKRNYFSSPWTIISLIAATILLILTFLQTFYTIYAYYKPPK